MVRQRIANPSLPGSNPGAASSAREDRSANPVKLLAGAVVLAAKTAHRLLDDFGEFQQAREVLAAIGR